MNQQQKKLFVISAIVVGVLLIGVVLLGFLSPKQENGPELKIDNLEKRVKNIPQDRRSAIQAMLLSTVKMNTSDSIEESFISNAIIRDNTEKQDFDETLDFYKGEFIVDIESLQQSYLVKYFYKKEADSFVTGGNTVEVTCLPKEMLIYAEFDCKDILQQQSQGVDPIISKLPYISTYFKISARYVDDTLRLKGELRIPNSEYGTTPASRSAAVKKYKEKAEQWIRTTGNDPATYTIEYNYADDGSKI